MTDLKAYDNTNSFNKNSHTHRKLGSAHLDPARVFFR
jgi:hypothetical protein